MQMVMGQKHLDEEFEFHGQWYQPDTPKHKIQGTYEHKPGKSGLLKLFGDISPHAENGIEDVPMKINILVCDYSEHCRIEVRHLQFATGRGLPDKQLVSHFETKTHVRIFETCTKDDWENRWKCFRVKLHGLHHWLDLRSVPWIDLQKIKRPTDLGKPSQYLRIDVDSFSLVIMGRIAAHGNHDGSSNLCPEGWFDIQMSDYSDVSSIQAKAESIRLFASFLMDEPLSIVDLDLYNTEGEPKYFYPQVALIPFQPDANFSRVSSWPDFLVPLKTIATKKQVPHNILQMAIDFPEFLELSSNLILGHLEQPMTQLLLTSFMIERFHREFYKDQYVGSSQLKTIKCKLKTAVNPKWNEALKQKIFGSIVRMNDFSYKKRILDIIEDLKPTVTSQFIQDPERFASAARAFRDDSAHEIGKVNHKKLSYADENRLKLLFKCAILRKVGFTRKEIAAMVEQKIQYSLPSSLFTIT